MRKFLVAIVAALCAFLALPAHGQSAFTGPSTLSPASAEYLFQMQVDAWHAACAMKRADCDKIKPPGVAYGLLWGMFGSYMDGEDAVMIDIRLMAQPFAYMVMVHEMIHYLQYQTGQMMKGSPGYLSDCGREEEAFTLTYVLNLRLGLVKGDDRMKAWDGKVVLPDGTTFLVHEGYGCPLHAGRATAIPPG